MSAARVDRLQGALLGSAVGDALGLPYEGMSKGRVRRMLGGAPLRHRFAFGRGMVSDDTDHACFVAKALATAGDAPSEFARVLARHLRWWLAALPAGVGFGTLRAIVKLWLGYSPATSGVWSAGNGPAMRAPLIGAYAADDRERRHALVSVSTRVTHRDPKAEQGARAIAAAAAFASRGFSNGAEALCAVADEVDDPELLERLAVVRGLLHVPTADVVRTWHLDEGVTGYIYDTVPAVLHCWARHDGDIAPALEEIIRCGGDTDTTGAILGGLCGAMRGASHIPRGWCDGILEWPRSVDWIMRMGGALADGSPPLAYFWPGTLMRNTLFTLLVYGQIVRRMLPPY